MPPRQMNRIRVVGFLLSLGLLLTPAGIRAASDTPATPTPEDKTSFILNAVGDFPDGYFDILAEPGQTSTLTARVTNVGTLPVDLQAFATNAYNLPNGGFAATDLDEQATGTTTWLDLPVTAFSLEPEEHHEIAFDVTVPAGTAPGQYVTAIVVRTQGDLEIPGSDIYRQIIRSAMSVVINVPGDYPTGFELGEPAFDTSAAIRTLDIPITNTGRYVLRPEGELRLTDTAGNVVATSSVQMKSVYGGNTTIVQLAIPDQLPVGDYLVSLDLTDEATGASDSIENAPVTLAEPEVENPEVFTVDNAAVTPNGDPVHYADVAATIINNGQAIPTANVTLNVQRDGEEVESYPLAQNQALPTGSTDFSQRYIPVDGWQPGAWTFQLIISAVSGDTETILATIDIESDIVIP